MGPQPGRSSEVVVGPGDGRFRGDGLLPVEQGRARPDARGAAPHWKYEHVGRDPSRWSAVRARPQREVGFLAIADAEMR